MSNKIKITPLKAIRAKCLDCCVGQPSEVRKCTDEDCALFPYRFGHNPSRKGIGFKRSPILQKSDS